ncbi:hypothetical protein J3D46_003580 [Paenarthrobacter sp. A20]|nr:hypothetical protein [Paenarthrobacter sp. A20]
MHHALGSRGALDESTAPPPKPAAGESVLEYCCSS